MPISRKNFNNGKFQTRHSDRVKHPVAVLLRENSNLAFNVKEISKKVKMNEDTVRSMLRSLQQDGLIIHKQPFFAWKEVKRSTRKRRK